MQKTHVHYWIALRLVPRLAIAKKIALVDEFGLIKLFETKANILKSVGLTEKQVFAINYPNWQRIQKIVYDCEKSGGAIVTFQDSLYPALLKQIYDPPLVLFIKGDGSKLNSSQVGIVGSRFATINGKETAKTIAIDLVNQGVTVCSGLALGIDASAHKGALNAKGVTIAVIATGIDIVYPARHKELSRNIIESGGVVVSEFLPGVLPKPGNFPRRNRLISGMSLGVVVVEAAIKSGSLITARCAIEQNREVFAVPGSVNNKLAQGCHWLIKQGAKLIESTADILEELDFPKLSGPLEIEGEKSVKIADQDLCIDPLLASVGYEVTPVDIVASRSKLPIEEVLSRLTILELRSLVSAVPGGYLRLNRG